MKVRYPYVAVRTPEGVIVQHEDTFYDQLTAGPWRPERKFDENPLDEDDEYL